MSSPASVPNRPVPLVTVGSGINHDPIDGRMTPVFYGDALYVEVHGSRTGIDLNVVLYARNRDGQFHPQCRLQEQMPRMTSHADAVNWTRDFLAGLIEVEHNGSVYAIGRLSA